MAVQYPLINGVRYDYSSIEIRIAGKQVLGIKDISYSDTLEPGKAMGTSAQKLGRTRGLYDPSGSFTLYRAEGEDLIALLSDGFMEVSFDVVVSYAESDRPATTDTLVGCRMKKKDNSLSSGTDPLEMKFDLDVMYILHNGIAPIRNLRK